MTPSDIVVAVLVVAAIIVLLRLTSANNRSQHTFSSDPLPDYDLENESVDSTSQSAIPLVGSEIPFPFDIREITDNLQDDSYPRMLNYYFDNTSLTNGPSSKLDFFDELHLEFINPADGHKWNPNYIIATPIGLQKHLEETKLKHLYGTDMIILPQYDLANIMRAVLERQLAAWLVPESENEKSQFVDFPE